VLSRRYRALPQTHLGPFVEADLVTVDRQPQDKPGSSQSATEPATEVWSVPQPTQTLDIEVPAQDVFEVRVLDERRGMRLVAVVELTSPANKDRPETRQAFVSKCFAYLQEQVSVVIVDVVTERYANFHQQLLELVSVPTVNMDFPDLYTVAYRNRSDNGTWHLDLWPVELTVGAPLPTMPLWLAANLSVPLDLERTYQETCAVLRID
jgi:hypothetical protein